MEKLRRDTILPDKVNEGKIKRLSIKRTICFISDCTGVPMSFIAIKSRKRAIVETRQLVVYFLSLKDMSWERIGKYVGLDHASAYHARNAVEDLIFTNKAYYLKVQSLGQHLELILKTK